MIFSKNLKYEKNVYSFKIDKDANSYACRSEMGVGVNHDLINQYTVTGTIFKGTDKIALKIKDDKTLSFLTGAAVEAGINEGDDFVIVQNDENELTAIGRYSNDTSVITINKNKGEGIWSKVRPSFLYGETPMGFSYYLSCSGY